MNNHEKNHVTPYVKVDFKEIFYWIQFGKSRLENVGPKANMPPVAACCESNEENCCSNIGHCQFQIRLD